MENISSIGMTSPPSIVTVPGGGRDDFHRACDRMVLATVFALARHEKPDADLRMLSSRDAISTSRRLSSAISCSSSSICYQIFHFGRAVGVRDVERLKSAIGTPSAVFGGKYLHPSIIEMAAAYLYHLVENHPFMDGNKRGGAMALLIFLDMNGYEFEVADADLTAMVLKVVSGKMMKSEISVLFRQHAHSR